MTAKLAPSPQFPAAVTLPLRTPLPDVAGDAAGAARPLDWVGMDRIALPLQLVGGDGVRVQVPASVDIAVDLRDADARGIHMSRLYLRLQEALAAEPPGHARLRQVLQDCIDSQQGLSSSARIALRFEQLLRRRALASDNSGWKAYPVEMVAQLTPAGFTLDLTLSVDYSSTCPASAALSRQLNALRFGEDFGGAQPLTAAVVQDWLQSPRGLAATPHAQRSRATVTVRLRPMFEAPPVEALVDAVEDALGTPVQTAVKREDEQAFAALNAANLMFCEDAARRIAATLSSDERVERFDVAVAHLESLHAHDAVARVSGGRRD